jgi:ectoine hydroxylase-related dioxygenase (phytanoyl-CoA dioxygenase family)
MIAPADEAGIEAAVAGLEDRGFAIIERLVGGDVMADLASELAADFNAVELGDGANCTRRIHSRVLTASPTLQTLVIHPVVLGVLDRMLGPNCVRYQLSSVQGIDVDPGASDQNLHRDDDIFRLPHPHPCFEINVMWAVTDFSAENGATRVVPGSHRLASGDRPDPRDAVAVDMAAGSILMWQGATWHGAGANCSSAARTGVYVGYSLGWLRQEETLYLALPPEAVHPMPERLQRLIGYELKGSSTLGWLDGRDPRDTLGLDC